MKKITLISILILSILISLNFASAETNVTECDTPLNTSDTTYTLNQSISIWDESFCIGIEADNVTLDCKGYTMTYGGSDADYKAIANPDGYDNITIKNCIINQNGSAPAQHAISFEISENAIIFNNTITTLGGLAQLENGTYGIRLGDNSINANITSNTINTSETYSFGIFLADSGNSIIDNNVIITSGDYADGLFIDDSPNNNLTSNNITTSGSDADAIYNLMNCSSSLIYNNTITTSGDNYSDGVYLDDNSESMNVTSNTIITSGESGYGINMYSKENNLTSNTITTSGNTSIGIYSGDNSSIVYGNTITTTGSGGDGIYINSASFNNVTNNIINTTNGFAIWVAGLVTQDYNHTITNNTEQGEKIYYLFNNDSEVIENENVGEVFIASSNNLTLNNLTLNYDGITFVLTDNSTIKNSTILLSGTGIGWGIGLGGSYNNNITNNTITTSGADVDGIYLESANHSTFTQNKVYITGNDSFVIYLGLSESDPSGNNTFYNNLFNASTINSLSSSGFGYQGNTAPNDFVWNTTKTAGTNIVGKGYIGGNYWTNNNSNGYSDTCIDSDGDYICDTPYSFDNIDYLPLTVQTNAAPSCSTLNTGNKLYYLNQSISVTGTCFNITANNITINFVGYTLTGDTTGYGINVSGCNDTTIQDGTISNFSNGIYLEASSNNAFTNFSINDSMQDAIYLTGASSSDNNFTDMTVANTNSSYYDINFSTEGINGTWLIDTVINSYRFTGTGGIVNFKVSGSAIVEFLEPINGSGTNLTLGDVNVESNLIFVNSSNNIGLNKSAKITFYGIGLTESKPQYSLDNNVWTDCTTATDPVCNIISASGTTPVFNVSHFTYFKVAEAYSAPPGGGGGAGPSGGLVCAVGAIQCVGTVQYQECLESGTVNKWSETFAVPTGKMCKFGALAEVEADIAAEEVEETAAEEAVPEEIAKEVEALEEVRPLSKVWETITGLSWLWISIVIIIIGVIVYFSLRKKE